MASHERPPIPHRVVPGTDQRTIEPGVAFDVVSAVALSRTGGAGRGSNVGRACPRSPAAIVAALTSPAMPTDSTAVRVVVFMCRRYARYRPRVCDVPAITPVRRA